ATACLFSLPLHDALPIFSMPIGAGSVEVAHSQSVGRVEHQVGTSAQLVDTSFGGQLSGEVDVRRTTQCGGSEADPTDLEMSAPEPDERNRSHRQCPPTLSECS